MSTFRKLVNQKEKIPDSALDDFFSTLEPVNPGEMIGKWQGGYFRAGKSCLEFFLKNFIIFKWWGKIFLSNNNVKALVCSFFGIKFNIPGGTAKLTEMEFRGKVSASMVYDNFSIVDYFRKIDNNTIMGVMEAKGETKIYFYLIRQ